MQQHERDVASDAIECLARGDPALAADATTALESLTTGRGSLADITQHGLQSWLWSVLAHTSCAEPEHKLRLAGALGRLLEVAELPRYAQICTSSRTSQVLAAYERGNGDGRAAQRRAMANSGVEPPDVAELAWGASMGPVEVRAHDAVASALELAIAVGSFRPGSSGWRAAQQAVTRQLLLRPRPELDGECWLDRVLAERVQRWTDSRGEARRRLLAPLQEELLGAQTSVPADAARHVAPLCWLLERAADELPLTPAHRLRPGTVVELVKRFDWGPGPGARRLEADVVEARTLRELAHSTGLLRRSRQRLVLTPAGRRVINDAPGLWRAVCRRLVTGDAFSALARESALAVALRVRAASGHEVASAVLTVLTGEGWRDRRTGEPPEECDVQLALAPLRAALEVLGLLPAPRPGAKEPSSWALEESGRLAALEALTARATQRSGPGR